jgi:NADPH:quinone reductase-like Zn-dependent oxidoreductase
LIFGVPLFYKILHRELAAPQQPCSPPEVLKMVEEATLPEPREGEVRIKVLATSASFTDTLVRKGKYPGIKQTPPFSPGYDMVGVIDIVGEGVTKFTVGQRVAALTVIGSYSQYICLPEDSLVPVPKELDPAEAVSLVVCNGIPNA